MNFKSGLRFCSWMTIHKQIVKQGLFCFQLYEACFVDERSSHVLSVSVFMCLALPDRFFCLYLWWWKKAGDITSIDWFSNTIALQQVLSFYPLAHIRNPQDLLSSICQALLMIDSMQIKIVLILPINIRQKSWHVDTTILTMSPDPFSATTRTNREKRFSKQC